MSKANLFSGKACFGCLIFSQIAQEGPRCQAGEVRDILRNLMTVPDVHIGENGNLGMWRNWQTR